MPPEAIERLPARYVTEHAVIVSSAVSRSQVTNREHCVAKLRAAVESAMRPPKVRRQRKPSRAAKRKRLEAKQQQSDRKRSRRINRNPPRD